MDMLTVLVITAIALVAVAAGIYVLKPEN